MVILQRAAVELAKQWRSDNMLRKLEAMLDCHGSKAFVARFWYRRSH